MGHSVGDAAKRSTAKGDAVKKSERTSEQIMKDLRHNLASNLAVTPDDRRFLLAQYDVLLKNFIEQQTVAFQSKHLRVGHRAACMSIMLPWFQPEPPYQQSARRFS